MLATFRDLVQHKAFANASLLRAIRHHEPAAQDAELHRLLHHIILANRFWLMLCLELPFAHEEESHIPGSLEAISARYRDTHAREWDWLSRTTEGDLARTVTTPHLPGQSFTLAEVLTQVCLHSHGHRAQCATRLRLLGGTPPTLDFIVWLQERAPADWA